jgi:cobalt/nickel transport system permease protein
MGGVLASVILGPWAGFLAITLVLIVQCALFSDGGLLALGANVLNMGGVGALGGYAMYAALRRLLGSGSRGTIAATVAAAWLSVMAAAALFCIELRISHSAADYNFSNVFTLMIVVHCAIGVGEALITGGVVSFVLAQRPDLIYEPRRPAGLLGRMGRTVAAGAVVALAVAAFLAPFASESPDGLEAVGERTGFGEIATEKRVFVFEDYAVPSPVAAWKEAPTWQKVSVSLAGMLGTVIVLAIALGLGRSLRTLASPSEPTDAR